MKIVNKEFEGEVRKKKKKNHTEGLCNPNSLVFKKPYVCMSFSKKMNSTHNREQRNGKVYNY